jgi:hypothetical protein
LNSVGTDGARAVKELTERLKVIRQSVAAISDVQRSAMAQVDQMIRRPLEFCHAAFETSYRDTVIPGESVAAQKSNPTKQILSALLAVQQELLKWNDHSPSETGYVVEDVPAGHPLHTAVSALEKLYGRALPRPARGHWRQFLKLARNDDEGTEDEADWLVDWVEKEIERHSSTEHSPMARPIKNVPYNIDEV